MYKNIFLIFLTPVILWGDPSIEDIKLQIKDAHGIKKVEIMNSLAERYLSVDPDSSLYYAHNSLSIAKQLENDTLAANSTYLIGRAHILCESYDKALIYSSYSYQVYRENKNIQKYMLSLIDMGIISYNLSSYNAALAYYKILLSISKSIDDKEWYAIALDGIGTTHFLMGNYDFALDYLNSSLKEYIKLKKENIKARLLYGIGAVYMTMSQYDKALDYLFRSVKLAEERKHTEYLAMSNHAIGVIYEKLKNFSMAIKYDNIALEFAESINDKYLIGSLLIHSGEVYLHMSDIDTALTIANKALRVQEEILNKVGTAHAYDLIGKIHLHSHHYNKALINLKKAQKILEKIDQKYWQTKILNHLGVVYAKIGKHEFATNYLNESLKKAKKIGAQDLVLENLTALSEYHALRENHKKAYTYLEEYTYLNDSIFTTSSHHIAEMQMRYETGKREKENELLKTKIEIQKLEIEKSNLKNWISYLSLTIVSIIGFFSYNRYKVKKRANILLEKKIEDGIKKHQAQQEIIFHQANLSSLGELAAGMAHEINQPLQAIKLATESLDLDIRELSIETSSMKDNIAEIYEGVERAKNIIDHVRVFASQQKNHIDEYFKPSTVVENALSLIGKQYLKKDIQFKLKLNKRTGKIKGNPYKYEQIVFNLLSNAKDALIEKEQKLNQSYEKIIEIQILREEIDIVLIVKDNGIGMNKDQKDSIFSPFYTTKNLGEGTGLGLSIVFGLVREMNGRILVSSTYNSGTSVRVCIPKVIVKKGKTKNNQLF